MATVSEVGMSVSLVEHEENFPRAAENVCLIGRTRRDFPARQPYGHNFSQQLTDY